MTPRGSIARDAGAVTALDYSTAALPSERDAPVFGRAAIVFGALGLLMDVGAWASMSEPSSLIFALPPFSLAPAAFGVLAIILASIELVRQRRNGTMALKTVGAAFLFGLSALGGAVFVFLTAVEALNSI